MQSSAWVTRVRLSVRHVLCQTAFPLVPALCSTNSAADRSALFAGFTATMAGSDFSCPCIIGYGSLPSQCGPSLSRDADGQTRDLPASDAIRLKLLAPAMSDLSWLNPTPHAIAVYASQPLSPVATQHSLPSGRYSLLGPDFTSTGWIAPALPGALIRLPRRCARAASAAFRGRVPWRSLG